ncbi:MAG TPA: hypothetical protein VII01_08520 [Solirubrobacteraceae bacterium]
MGVGSEPVGLQLGEEVAGGDTERVGELDDREQARVASALLDAVDLGRMEVGAVPKRSLAWR